MILQAFELKGKNALITGSSRGLGAAIAIALAEAGASESQLRTTWGQPPSAVQVEQRSTAFCR